MHECEFCHAEYTSQFAAVECAEQDAIEDRNTRGWYARMNPHRKD